MHTANISYVLKDRNSKICKIEAYTLCFIRYYDFEECKCPFRIIKRFHSFTRRLVNIGSYYITRMHCELYAKNRKIEKYSYTLCSCPQTFAMEIRPPRLKAETAAEYGSAWSTDQYAAAAAAAAVAAAAVPPAAAAAVVDAAVAGGTTRDKWTKWCPPSLGPTEFSKTAHRGRDLHGKKD